MATPSPKRRKLSPTSVIEAPENGPESTRRTPTRASFLSPTKASLSRFNPSLLPQTTTSGRASLPQNATPSLQAGFPVDSAKQEPGQITTRRATDGGAASSLFTGQGDNSDSADARGHVVASQGFNSDGAELQAAPDALGDQLSTPSPKTLKRTGSLRPKRNKSLGIRLSKSPMKTFPPIQNQSTAVVENLPQRIRTQTVNSTPRHGTSANETVSRTPKDSSPESKAKAREKVLLEKELHDMKDKARRFRHAITTFSRSEAEKSTIEDVQRLTTLLAEGQIPEAKRVTPYESTPLSVLLTSLLPFASFAPRPPTPPPSPSIKERVPSHLPVDVQNPLSFLQLFSSLSCTTRTRVNNLQDMLQADNFSQNHTVELSDTRQSLNVSITLSLDVKSRSVTRISITKVSNWADYELGQWIRLKAQELDVGTVFWATNSYYELAHKRAQCWQACERKFPDLFDLSGPTEPSNTRPKGNPPRAQGSEEDEEEVSGILADREGAISKSDEEIALWKHLGADSIILKNKHIKLRVSWQLSFDWTGECIGNVRAQVAFPPAWSEVDDRRSLNQISDTFDRILKERGPTDAITILSRLLFS